MHEQFKKDLVEKGEPAEIEVLNRLRKWDKDAKRVIGYCKEWDIVCPNIELNFEVKNCKDAIIFIPIEVSADGKPSGLETTKADYWVIHCKKKYYMIETGLLKELVSDLAVREYLIQGQNMGMKLLKISKLLIYGREL